MLACYRSCNQGAKISAAIADKNYLLGGWQTMRNFFFNGLRSNVVARIQHNKILDASADSPIAANIHLALITGVKPAITQHASCLFRPLPIPRKDVRPAHQNFVIFAYDHFNAGNGWTDVAGLDRNAWIIHGANRRGFRKTVDLQYRNVQHQKKLLRLRRQGSGAANQSSNMRAEASSNFSKNKFTACGEPERIKSPATTHVLALPCGRSAPEKRTYRSAAFGHGLVNAAPHALKQRRNVEKIIRAGQADFFNKTGQIRGKRKLTHPRQAGEQKNPGAGKIKRQVVENAIRLGCLRVTHELVEPFAGATQHVINVSDI